MAADEPYLGKSSTDLSDGFILKGWAFETLQTCYSSKNDKSYGKDKEVAKPKASTTQSKYHGYWEKEELCFAFKHFQETDKYIQQYRQEKFRIQENYYKDALTKVRRQSSVLDDLINQSSCGVVECSDKLNFVKEQTISPNFRQSPSVHKQYTTGSNPLSDNSQITLSKSFQGGIKPSGLRLKTGLLWKRSMSDSTLRARKNTEEIQNQSNWTVIGIEKHPSNNPNKERRGICHSAPPKKSLARFNSLRQCSSLCRTSKTSINGNKQPQLDQQETRKKLHINTIREDLSAIREQKNSNSQHKQNLELNRTKYMQSPSDETHHNRRPVINMNNLGDTFISGVGVGGSDTVTMSTRALPHRGSLKTSSSKDKGLLGYVSSKSNYTDLFKHVINHYQDTTIETDPKLLSIKNF